MNEISILLIFSIHLISLALALMGNKVACFGAIYFHFQGIWSVPEVQLAQSEACLTKFSIKHQKRKGVVNKLKVLDQSSTYAQKEVIVPTEIEKYSEMQDKSTYCPLSFYFIKFKKWNKVIYTVSDYIIFQSSSFPWYFHQLEIWFSSCPLQKQGVA